MKIFMYVNIAFSCCLLVASLVSFQYFNNRLELRPKKTVVETNYDRFVPSELNHVLVTLANEHVIIKKTIVHENTNYTRLVPSISKNAVVTLANADYERCAIKLLHDLRKAGEWTGDIIFIVSYEVGKTTKDWLNAHNITVFPIIIEYDTPHFLKYEIFTNVFFRQYEKILYLDADTTVNLPIRVLFSVTFPPNVWILMRDNGPGMGKYDLHKNEFSKYVPVPNKKNPGATCAFVINMTLLPEPMFINSVLQTLHHLLLKSIKLYDQSVLHVLFLEHFAVFAPCNPLKVVLSNEVVDRLWNYQHCKNKTNIFVHDYKKMCMKSAHHFFTETRNADVSLGL
jgi:hypothetical protein